MGTAKTVASQHMNIVAGVNQEYCQWRPGSIQRCKILHYSSIVQTTTTPTNKGARRYHTMQLRSVGRLVLILPSCWFCQLSALHRTWSGGWWHLVESSGINRITCWSLPTRMCTQMKEVSMQEPQEGHLHLKANLDSTLPAQSHSLYHPSSWRKTRKQSSVQQQYGTTYKTLQVLSTCYSKNL